MNPSSNIDGTVNLNLDDSTVNEENEDNDDDEDDPFAVAFKELSETNRRAEEIARVSLVSVPPELSMIWRISFSNDLYNPSQLLLLHSRLNRQPSLVDRFFHQCPFRSHVLLFFMVFILPLHHRPSFDCNDRSPFHLRSFVFHQPWHTLLHPCRHRRVWCLNSFRAYGHHSRRRQYWFLE